MTDEEFIGYCEVYSQTERALLTVRKSARY